MSSTALEITSIHRVESPADDPSPSSSRHRHPSSVKTSVSNDSPRITKERSLDTHYRGAVIPPSTRERKKDRTLVLCFDGTGDQFDNDNSNVVQFFALLKKGESEQQLVYYQAGIGTYTVPQIASPIKSKVAKTIDMMVGSSLHHHVMGGYEFLMENYHEKDRICIFGFSRGAYTARALAGMIEKVGLLPAGNRQQVPFAYKMYMKDNEFGWKQSVLFKRTFSMDVDIEFVGVWDTVDAVGFVPQHAPFTKYNACVKTFRHAISLDERRVKFKANLYDKLSNELSANNDISFHRIQEQNEKAKKQAQKLWTKLRNNLKLVAKVDDTGYKLQKEYTDKTKKTDVLEVWFAGCHTDVGGGSVPNDTRNSLARIPLRWMVRQCFLAKSGIQFQAERLHEIGMDPIMLYPEVRERPPPLCLSKVLKPVGVEDKGGIFKCKDCPAHNVLRMDSESSVASGKEDSGSIDEKGTVLNCDQVELDTVRFTTEEHEELHDVLSPMYDQLNDRKIWWILEYLPLVHRVQKQDGMNVMTLSINAGRPRKYKQCGIKVHRSVKMRMEAEHILKPYKPRLRFEGEPEWVD